MTSSPPLLAPCMNVDADDKKFVTMDRRTFTMVAGAQDSGDQPASIVEQSLGKESENNVARLITHVKQRIHDENEQHPQNQSDDAVLAWYWDRVVGTSNAEEAVRVYNSMLNDVEQLNRILLARKHKMKDATALFFEEVRFRARWKPLEITPDSISNALPSGAWRLCGYSREGCVVSNYKLQHWNPDEYGIGTDTEQGQQLNDAIDEYTRYVVYMIEHMIGSMKPKPVPQQFVVLFDLSGFSTSLVFRSNVRLMIRKLIYVAQAQYPERLRKVLLVNAPYGFATAWKLIRPLLDEKTASKIHFVGTDEITNDIEPEVLSEEYGGTHPEYPVPSKTLQEERITH